MPDWKIPALCLVAALAFIEPSDILSRLKPRRPPKPYAAAAAHPPDPRRKARITGGG